MSETVREQVIAEGEARIEIILQRASDEIDRIIIELENTTGKRPRVSISGRANIMEAGHGSLAYYRERACCLLNAIRLLEPLMAGRPGCTVTTAMKTTDAATANRIAIALEGAGLVHLEEAQPIPPPE